MHCSINDIGIGSSNIRNRMWLLCMRHITITKGFHKRKGMANSLCILMISSCEIILFGFVDTDLKE